MIFQSSEKKVRELGYFLESLVRKEHVSLYDHRESLDVQKYLQEIWQNILLQNLENR